MADDNAVNLAAAFSAVGQLLTDARDDFEDSLDNIQDVIDDITWYGVRADLLTSEIGDITFENYQSVKELIESTTLQVTSQKPLLETGIEKHIVHVFEASSLDEMESKVVDMVRAAGSGEMKNLSGVALSDSMRSALIRGQDTHDSKARNDALSLLSRYSSPNTSGNRTWLIQQFNRKAEDRERNIYSTLFALAQENVAWAYQQGISIEKMHENFTARYNRLFLDMTAANIATYKAEVRGNIAEFEAKLQEISAQMKVEELKLNKDSTEYELKIQQANSRLQEYVKAYAAAISTNTKNMSSRIVGGKNIADGYKSIYSAYSSQYSGISLSNSTPD